MSDVARRVSRHLGMWCGCPLLDCCHNELTERAETCGDRGTHAHSGNPATGFLYPWEPGDESWREPGAVPWREQGVTDG